MPTQLSLWTLASQVRFVPDIVGIYFGGRLITVPVLQRNVQWDGRLRLIRQVLEVKAKSITRLMKVYRRQASDKMQMLFLSLFFSGAKHKTRE